MRCPAGIDYSRLLFVPPLKVSYVQVSWNITRTFTWDMDKNAGLRHLTPLLTYPFNFMFFTAESKSTALRRSLSLLPLSLVKVKCRVFHRARGVSSKPRGGGECSLNMISDVFPAWCIGAHKTRWLSLFRGDAFNNVSVFSWASKAFLHRARRTQEAIKNDDTCDIPPPPFARTQFPPKLWPPRAWVKEA